MVAFADRPLTALVNTATSDNIPDFPDTATVLSRMSSAAINRVLLGLGLGTDGGLESRRDRLRVAIELMVGGV